ncbi:hypothetical protein MKW94_001782, partial [Papaver nudicaule]|nr:hypothetical protein [Papaver nudicaule]
WLIVPLLDSEIVPSEPKLRLCMNNITSKYFIQIAYSLFQEQEGKAKTSDDYISFVTLLADPRYCGVSYLEKEEVRVLPRKDPKFWTYRPFTEQMLRATADDVRFLLHIYHKMMENLNDKSLWHLSVRGALYCRCFCVNDNENVDWPPIPPIPGNIPVEEILSVLHVPPGKMGLVIGRRGATIMSVKQSCDAEILMGGSKGPPDKVFIIGPVRQVRKAEALLRGRMLYIRWYALASLFFCWLFIPSIKFIEFQNTGIFAIETCKRQLVSG